MRIRKGSKLVQIDNTGLLVYLYDPAHRATIERDGVAILETGSDAKGKAALGVARDGLLVAYELRQDDPVKLELIVGKPLAAKELAKGRFLEPQRARLKVSSGVVHVDSPDTLRLGGEDPTDEGATLKIPKGDYVLTLHRTNWDGLKAALIDATDFPHEVLTLTKVGGGVEMPEIRETALPYVTPKKKPELATEAIGKVAGGSWNGVVVEGEGSTLSTGFDEKAAAKLGLTWGDGLLVAAGKLERVAIFVGDMSPDDYIHSYGASRLLGPPVRDVARWHEDRGKKHLVIAGGALHKARFPDGLSDEATRFGLAKKTKLTLTKLPAPFDVADSATIGRWTLESGRISTTILNHSRDMLGLGDGWIESIVLDLDETALRKLRAGPADVLRLRVGKDERELHLFASRSDCASARDVASKLPPEQKAKQREVWWAWRKAGFSGDPKERDPRRAVELRRELDALSMPSGVTVVGATGHLVDHWYAAGKKVLRLYPLLVGLGFDVPIAIGTPVSIGKKGR